LQDLFSDKKHSILAKDVKYIWHPLTQHKTHKDVIPIVKAKGCHLFDINGNSYIDAISSWYTSVYGHCHSDLIKAIKTQSEKLDQIIFSGFTHPKAVALAEKLVSILPGKIQKVFYNDNGSTATEIGIKMALQYHHNLGNDRDTLLAFEEGFHGDTFGAMSVSGLSVYNGAFEKHFIKVLRLPKPDGTNNVIVMDKMNTFIKQNKIAGFIYEPLIQGAAGMKTYCKAGLESILEVCHSHDIISIADEVMTGFGKTGTNFASEQIAIEPNVICLSKALTAGMLPMGVTGCQQFIYDAFYDNDISKGLFHAHTYTANPLACAVALKATELLESADIQSQISFISGSHEKFKSKIEQHPKVENTRHLGIILAIDIKLNISRYGNVRDKIYNYFMRKGIYVRPLGKTIYLVPPYVISRNELHQVYNTIEGFLDEFNYL
jgi:adenosylmethionine-8-amino-7-oxononanoate aminotransferase